MGKVIMPNKEPVESGVFIGLPYPKDTPEYENAIDHLKEWSHQNSDSILVEECFKCDECGAINRTVAESDKKDVRLCYLHPEQY